MRKKASSAKKSNARPPASRRSKLLTILGAIMIISFVLAPLLPDVVGPPIEPTPTTILVFPTDTPTATPTPTQGPSLPTGGPPRPTP